MKCLASNAGNAADPGGLEGRRLPASFRDPSGYILNRNGEFIRAVLPAYREQWQQFTTSGLCSALHSDGLLIEHEELPCDIVPGAFKVLRPRQLPFVSYPYEWSFSQLRDAALATLRIQETALGYSMTLKDASAFNVQFIDGRPVFIDTLSFEMFALEPWAAYAQFCRHFLAPLALMSWRDGRLGGLLASHLDGVPLDLAARLLPYRSWLRPALALHLHAHAASNRWFQSAARTAKPRPVSLPSLLGLVQTLRRAVDSLSYTPDRGVWTSYYTDSVTGGGYLEAKERLVAEWLKLIEPRSLWDLGANTGNFSKIAAGQGIQTIAFDADVDCVELNYRDVREHHRAGILPLYLDLANPSPAVGWSGSERMSWLQRPHPDAVLALALVHHLAIGNNVPLAEIARFFSHFSHCLIIEFVPKHDPNAQKLLRVRRDIFHRYTQEDFEREFERFFHVEKRQPMPASERQLYLMRRK